MQKSLGIALVNAPNTASENGCPFARMHPRVHSPIRAYFKVGDGNAVAYQGSAPRCELIRGVH